MQKIVATPHAAQEPDIIILTLKFAAMAFAQTMGPMCEVVVHDLRQKKIVAIENGHVTGRKVGDKLHKKVYEYFMTDKIDSAKLVLQYPGKSVLQKKRLKCSTYLFPDCTGTPVATLCVNFNIEQLETAQYILSQFCSTPTQSENAEEVRLNSVRQHAKDIVMNIMQNVGKPFPLFNKKGRLMAMRELDAQGVFSVKDIVPPVCEALAISQATFYNYLKIIRKESQELSGGSERQPSV